MTRLHETNTSNEGYMMKIIEYVNNKNILVQFQTDEYTYNVWSRYEHFKNGGIKNVYHKSVFGIGYFGDGVHVARFNGEKTHSYQTWQGIMKRFYSNEWKNSNKTYIGCSVCDAWLNYQNFANWYHDNYYEVGGHSMSLDKDILIEGNMTYSPEGCVFVPKCINTLFIDKSSTMGRYPVGVIKHPDMNKLTATCSDQILNKVVRLGNFNLNDITGAKRAHTDYKMRHILDVANMYKNVIPTKLYEAMICRYDEYTKEV